MAFVLAMEVRKLIKAEGWQSYMQQLKNGDGNGRKTTNSLLPCLAKKAFIYRMECESCHGRAAQFLELDLREAKVISRPAGI
jgi:hypothetical protein